MGRLLWVAVGAAGGVLAYRRGQHLVQEARERGLVGSVQAATGTAAGVAGQARSALGPLRRGSRAADAPPAPASRPTGSAAARALAEARHRDPAP